MAIEIGKPVSHGLEEVRRAAGNIRDVIRRAAAFEFQKREPAGLVRHEPLGVVALISPWNNPVAIPVGKIAPALIYGNTRRLETRAGGHKHFGDHFETAARIRRAGGRGSTFDRRPHDGAKAGGG